MRPSMTDQRWATSALSFLLYFLLLALPGNATPDAIQASSYQGQPLSSTLAPPLPANKSFSSGTELESGHLNKRKPSRAVGKVETKYIDLALYSRAQYVELNPQAIAQRDFKSFHWAILTRSGGKAADAFDTSDWSTYSQGSETVRNSYKKGEKPPFRFQYKYGVKPEKSNTLLARITVGKAKTSTEAVTAALKEVPMPNCQESCVDWTLGAIRKLQNEGLVEKFNVQDFSNKAFDYALNRRTILRVLDENHQEQRFYEAKNAISQFQNEVICKKRPKM